MDSRSIIKALEKAGWRLERITGSHHHFKHPTIPGLVTVQHPRRDVPPGTLRGIEKQAAMKIRG